MNLIPKTMSKKPTYYQLISIPELTCHFYSTDLKEVEDTKVTYEDIWPNDIFVIEPGTDHILTKCRHCGNPNTQQREDAYGIPTGIYCDDCYENHYPYRKDRYDYLGAGERLEDDY